MRWAGNRKPVLTPASTLRCATSARHVRHRRQLPLDLREDGVSRIHQAPSRIEHERVIDALAAEHPAGPLVGLAGPADRGPGFSRQVRSTGGAQPQRLVVAGLEDLADRDRLVLQRPSWCSVQGLVQPDGGSLDAGPNVLEDDVVVARGEARGRAQQAVSANQGGGQHQQDQEVEPGHPWRYSPLLVAEGNSPARQVVGGQLDPDPVADQDPDVELAHLPRRIREDRLPGLQLDLEHRVGQRLAHLGVHLDRLFFAGRGLLDLERVDAGPQRGGTAAFLRIATFLAQTVDILPKLPVRESGACRSRPSWRATYGRSWSAKGSRSEPTRP